MNNIPLWIFAAGCTSPGVVLSAGPTSTAGDTGATADTDGPSDTSSDSGGDDSAAVVSADFPGSIDCGDEGAGVVAMQNTGTATWTRDGGYKLGAVDDSDPFYRADTRVWLPEDATVPPGESWTFDVPMEGPTSAGTYTTDWRMVKEGEHWFGSTASADVAVTCNVPVPRTGAVRLEGSVLTDDDGPFNALGATLFWAAWGYRNDRAKLERNLATLQAAGFDYIRALGVVGDPYGEDSWDGLEIEYGWSDYEEVIAGLTDLAYDTYGLRVEWTLIGDGQVAVPSSGEKYGLADRFLEMSVGREDKIIHFEIANEFWQNGFEGDEGLAELRDLTWYMNERTDILVASSAPAGHDCDSIEAVYAGGLADVATIHFDRDTSTIESGWQPVRQPWGLVDCADVPPGSNNEPIGPGSSVASEDDPEILAAAAIATSVSNVPFYVFHSSAGVRGEEDISAMSGYDAFVHVRDLVPADLVGWQRADGSDPSAPFQPFAEDSSGVSHPDTMWTDLPDPAAGAVRVYSGVDGNSFFTFPFGILNHLRLDARRDLEYTAWDPLTGGEVASGRLVAGQRITIEGYRSMVVRGTFE